MPGGRPTTYHAGRCQELINLMSEGRSVIASAVAMGVHVDTLYQWRKAHPEFSDAMEIGKRKSEAWWEEEARRSLHDKEFQTALWFINMKNRFRWSDKTEVQVDGNLSVNVKIEGVQPDGEH